MTNQRKASAKAVATKANTDVAAYDYGEYAGAGFETMGREDFIVPFLNLLQANSPIILERDDLKAGMIYNSASGLGYAADKDKAALGVEFVPFHREHIVMEWKPRDSGGGLVAQHSLDAQLYTEAKQRAEKFGKYKTSEGNELKETFNVFGLHISDWEAGEAAPAVLSFTSTKIKVYRQWMTRADAIKIALPNGAKIKPPLWAHRYRFNSVLQKKGGDTFFNLQIGFAGENAEQSRLAPDHPVFTLASDMYEQAKEGKMKVDMASLQREAGAEEDDAGEPTPF